MTSRLPALLLLAALLLCLLLSACDAPPAVGDRYEANAPGLTLRGRVIKLGGCLTLADREANDYGLKGLSLQPATDDPEARCAALDMEVERGGPGQMQGIIYVTPLEYLRHWRRIE